MNQNNLFQRTRWRLASTYAGVMGVILSLCGFGIYEAITHAHWVTLNKELKTVAGTLHDSLEPTLRQPGQLESATERLLPNICIVGASCPTQLGNSRRHILGAIHQDDYYMRLVDLSGRPLAFAGQEPEALSSDIETQSRTHIVWQAFKDRQGSRYQQISLALHTHDNRPWGYLQVGRSLKDFDDYLAAVRLILLLGLPAAMLLVGGASWWLAARAMQPIHQSYQLLQQFTADAAHELRTPLAAIQANVESALRLTQLPEPEARDVLSSVERQNHRLSQLVQDLLLLSRMEQQALPMKRQPCCLNELISDVEEEFSELALRANVLLRTEIRVPEQLYVTADQEQLYRLVSNLVINAIQYTSAGGQVSIVLDKSHQQALIHVQDTGIGIAPEHLPTRIFDRFYRANSDRSRHTGGSGLGLSIAQAIAQAHFGSIQVQSELGKGSTFTIRLSLRVILPSNIGIAE